MNEPQFGIFSTLSLDGYAYLFGHGAGTTNVMLARVKKEFLLERKKYTYWDGNKYQSNVNFCQPVMRDMVHGQFWKSELFHSQRHSWVFIGCPRLGSNKVMIAQQSA